MGVTKQEAGISFHGGRLCSHLECQVEDWGLLLSNHVACLPACLSVASSDNDDDDDNGNLLFNRGMALEKK